MAIPETLGERIKEAQKAAGVSNEELAAAARVHVKTVSQWRNDRQVPSDENLDAIAPLLRKSRAWLRYGDASGMVRERPAAYEPNPTLARRLPPRVYDVVLGYLKRMEQAGASPLQIEEAERLMVESNYSKLNAREPRERSETDLIIDIDAAWAAISSWLRANGFRV